MSNFNIHSSFLLNGKSFDTPLDLVSFSEGVSDDLFWFLQEWFSDSETLIAKTSGSTGTPKLVAINKEFMENSSKATGSFFDLSEGTKTLCCLSTEYIAGKMMVVRAITLGWHLDVVAPVNNPLKGTKKQYDFCAMVPMQVKASLRDLHLVNKLLIGGGVVSQGLHASLQNLTTQCFASYGMTETVSHIAIKKLNDNTISSNVEKSYYKLLPNITISQDHRDCLIINAPLLSDDEVVTNDIVVCYSETEFEWLGRYDNVINSGGVKLHPEQIEKELSKIISQRFFVTGIPDNNLGEKLILVVEGEQMNIQFDEVELSKYQTPKEIYFVNKFMETDTKKIQRKSTLDLISSI